jgi:hypothetical protein
MEHFAVITAFIMKNFRELHPIRQGIALSV